MDIWGSYESLPPLERIITTFTIILFFLIVVFRIDKWSKKRNREFYSTDLTADAKPWLNGNLEQKADGTLVAYISFWRYIFFGLLFAAAFYISFKGCIYLYQELPSGFWKNWNKTATLALITFIIAMVMPFMGFYFLKSGYKKVQLEINKDNIRYLKKAIRGGILLSDNYGSVPLQDIIDIELRQIPAGGGIITARTSTQSHAMILLLSVEEQQFCYRALEDAIKFCSNH